jgi:hypothetical protein
MTVASSHQVKFLLISVFKNNEETLIKEILVMYIYLKQNP